MRVVFPRIPTLVPVALAFLFVLYLQCISDPKYLWNEIYYLSHPVSERNALRVGVYLFGYLLSVLAVFALVFSRGIVVPLALATALLVTSTLDISYQLLGTRTGFDLNEYELARDARAMAGNIGVYSDVILRALLISLVLLVSLLFIRTKVPEKRRSRLVIFIPIIATVIATILSIKVFSINAFAFPALVKVPAVIAHYEHELSENGKYSREFDSNLVVENSRYKDVVWIIDESIRGDYFAVNGYPRDTTPYLNSIMATADVANFGVTSSAGSHSALSNLALRIGLQPKHGQNFDASRFTLPTIYRHAKHAGYTTTLIDAQMSNGQLHNDMSIKDLKDIDVYLTADRGMDVFQRDRYMIDAIKTRLGRTEKNFVVLVKWGAHWPYQYTYPKTEEFFTPTLATVMGSMTLENKDKVINTYLNAVRYAADGFLRKLLEAVELQDRIIVYTSDHGQTLLENASVRTHGDASSPSNGQGSVPLLLFSKNVKQLFPDLHLHEYSSFQIFTTTLKFFGYSDLYIANYGPTLFSVPAREYRAFFVTSGGKMQEYHFEPGDQAALSQRTRSGPTE